MSDVEPTGKKRFPTTQIILNALAAAFLALVISLIAFSALSDKTLAESLKTGLWIASGTILVSIIIQMMIHGAKDRA